MLFTIVLLATPACHLQAQKLADHLKRMVPVADEKPVPTADFFRPPLFTAPKLNPSGSHFAALVSTRDDQTDLMVFHLATKTAQRLSPGQDLDVRSFHWLNDERLVFSVVKDKIYAAGIFAAELGQFSRAYALQRYNAVELVGFPKNKPSHVIMWIRQSVSESLAATTLLFMVCFAALGAGNGALFQLVPLRWPASTAVAGSMIGEIGALGGGLVPNAMGLSKQYFGSYFYGFLLFAVLAVAVLLMMRVMQIRWTRTWAEKGGRARVMAQHATSAAARQPSVPATPATRGKL